MAQHFVPGDPYNTTGRLGDGGHNDYGNTYGGNPGGKGGRGKGRRSNIRRGGGGMHRESDFGGKGQHQYQKGGKGAHSGAQMPPGSTGSVVGEGVPRPDLANRDYHRKLRPCKYFNMGHCRNGDRCKFAHNGVPGMASEAYPNYKYHHKAAPYTSQQGQPAPQASAYGMGPPGGVVHEAPFEDGEGDLSTQADLGTLPLTMSTIMGNAVAMARHQRGSRVLQEALEAQIPGEYTLIDAIFVELLEHFVPLMTDLYGNYVCQKLLRKCRPVQVHAIVKHIQDDLVELSQDPHGTRAVQFLIRTLAMHPHYLADVQLIVKVLEDQAIALIHSMHGNHVIQSCLTNFSCTTNQFVHKTILEHFVHVANNRYGCCVLQCCLKTGNYDQYQAILAVLCENTLVLVKDAYGNYAVQFILDRGDPEMYTKMFSKMQGHIGQLSMQKFSSNVIEKGLRWEPEFAPCASLIVSELANTDKTRALLHSPYGNYVIQKALTVPSPSTVDLAAAIRPHLPALRNVPYGKKLEKLVKQAYMTAGMPLGSIDLFATQDDPAGGANWEPQWEAPLVDPMQHGQSKDGYGLNSIVPPLPTQLADYDLQAVLPNNVFKSAQISPPEQATEASVSEGLSDGPPAPVGANPVINDINDPSESKTSKEEEPEFDSLIQWTVKELQIED